MSIRAPLEVDFADDPVKAIAAQLMRFPAITKEAHELTDAERIALCIAAGCKMDYRTEQIDGSYRLVATTENPVGIAKINGKFQVYELKARP